MTRVLVSGAQAHMDAVAGALRDLGAEVADIAQLSDLPEAVATAGDQSFDSYVQLGATFAVEGTTAVERVHHFFADGVLARFTALDAVLRAPRRPRRVTMVMGELPPELATAADRHARRALCEVLAQAAHADVAPAALEIEILPAATSPEDIARTALGSGTTAASAPAVDLRDLRYEDWRVEILGLAQLQT